MTNEAQRMFDLVRLSFLLNIFFFLLAYGNEPAGEEWPMFRGNPGLSGVAGTTLPADPQLLWTFQAEQGIESAPAIFGNTVFITALDGQLYALNGRDGSLKWKYAAAGEIKSSPTFYRQQVFFGDESGLFHAVDAHSGKKRWTFASDGEIISSANVSGDRVIFGSYDQFLYCLSVEDGRELWRLETGNYVHSSPAISGSDAVIAGCDGVLRMIDIASGVERHALPVGSYVAASTAIHDGRAYFGTFDNQVLCVDLAEARQVWVYEHPKRQFPFYASAAVSGKLAVIAGRDKLVHALDTRTGEARWTFPLKTRIDASPFPQRRPACAEDRWTVRPPRPEHLILHNPAFCRALAAPEPR